MYNLSGQIVVFVLTFSSNFSTQVDRWATVYVIQCLHTEITDSAPCSIHFFYTTPFNKKNL